MSIMAVGFCQGAGDLGVSLPRKGAALTSNYSLKSLAGLADDVARLSDSLNAAQSATLQAAIHRAVAGDEISPESLREILGGSDSAEDVDANAALVGDFIAAQRELLPSVLSAALRSDHRLVDLPAHELVALAPVWVGWARQAAPANLRALARLLGMLAEHRDLPDSAGVLAQLRRIFLTAERQTAQIALCSLLATVGPRTEDRRFFLRLDLHMACGPLGEGAGAALGLWLVQEDVRWKTLVEDGVAGPLRHRLRAARLLLRLGRCADLRAEDRLAQAVEICRTLLSDPEPLVWSAVARALARFALFADLGDLWEPSTSSQDPDAHLERLAAGVGAFTEVDREWGAALVDELCDMAGEPGAVDLCDALAHACGDLARHHPELAASAADAILCQGADGPLATLGQQLARQQLAEDPPPVDPELHRRMDLAFGAPHGMTALQWARTLEGRESLLLLKGGKPDTSLSLRAWCLARTTLRGDAPGKVLAEAASLIDAIGERLEEADAPLFSEETVSLGSRMHGLEDLTALLFREDLLTAVVATAAWDERHQVDRYERRLRRLRAELRALLHRHAGDMDRPAAWRAHCLGLGLVAASAVPDHPVGRPANPRMVGFCQLVGFPEFLQAWAQEPSPEGIGATGVAQGLDALLGPSLPGGGDALLSLLLLAPSASAMAGLSALMTHPRSRGLLVRLAAIVQQAPPRDTPAEDRVEGLLRTVDELLSELLESTSFISGRLREAVVELGRHVRTATGHDRLISFMTPVRRSLEDSPQTLLVALAQDIAALHRIAGEGAERARIMAMRATDGGDGGLSRQAEQAVSQAALASASFEASAVVAAEDVGDAVRRGAGAGVDDRLSRAAALGDAAKGLGAFADLVERGLSGSLGELLSALLRAWSRLVDQRRSRSLKEPDHPLLVDRFRIERLLGEGGMAFTYLARDPDLDRFVTLKVMKPAICQQPHLRAKFVEEGKAIAALPPHPHVVQAFEFLDSESAPCLVMEYVDGEALIDVIPEEGMPLRLGLEIAVAAAQGLHHVHRNQMVHLDVKSENLMLTRDGTPKLIDFGLAQRDGAEHEESEMVLGTPCYMSPEQAMGKALDPASDVYSFGVMLYEIFTGDVPFDDADPRKILQAHVTEAPDPMSMRRPGLPDGLVLLVADTLHKKKASRPWMVEVASRLKRLLASLAPAEGEGSTLARREITVLCVALRGLDPEERAPEEIASLLESFLTGASEIVNGMGGRVDATVGERIFAVFGYPRGDARAAHKAVKAATMLRARMCRMGSGDLDTCAGVSCGQALVGLVRGDPTDATVLGPPLENAATLAKEAEARGSILVDEPTHSMIRGTVATGGRRRLRSIGKVWEVQGG